MRIGELASRSGFRPSAIRFYERAGLLSPALRQNGQRRFAADAELHLSVIAFAQKAGFTLAEIKVLFHGFEAGAPASRRWKTLGRRKIQHIDFLIERLKQMQHLLRSSSRCRCARLEDCGRMLRAARCGRP